MKVYLDDERETPSGWTRTYWPMETINLLQGGQVTHLSLDHDLGNDEIGTGYDVLLWIEKAIVYNNFKPPLYITVHSANPPAKKRMLAAINKIHKLGSIQ